MTENRFECNENKVIDNCTNGVTECKNSNEAYLLCNFLNEQDKTIEKQKLIIAENENLIQVDYDELTKLRKGKGYYD